MGSRLPRDTNVGLPPLRWSDLDGRRAGNGAWPPPCPLCRTPLASHDDDLRWLADHGRLVRLPDGCGAHRYCAIENPNRDPALIVAHEHVTDHDGSDRRRQDRRRG
jgi:hypothetical protein